MRFRKGSKVEVLSKKEVPSGSWRSAEIISGSGHYYTVRYDKFEGGSNQTVVERVSRKAIRPCPPSLEVLENWISGDVVEVFNDRSWKMAMVSEVLGKNNYLVRLLGSSSEFKVCKFDIRARRSWQDDKWVLMHKRSGNHGNDSKEDANASPRFYGLSSQIQKFQNVPNLDTWRRGSNYECSQAETMGRAGLKCRTLKKKRRYHKVVARDPSTLHEHVKSLVIQRVSLTVITVGYVVEFLLATMKTQMVLRVMLNLFVIWDTELTIFFCPETSHWKLKSIESILR
ncbi:uncharacterized protein LOC111465575 isoform X4 [Cucurbita maxima]|uniref:Uncharacterized protein LOC111465575 isoform X4 n=1 Tax=Cucurbita maxima TaxID=3661 RepID=A0A6J1HPR4_CUCMA|nr:uncharacterized protein LOC111465575 isoform X4 [Cucurbita maxima]